MEPKTAAIHFDSFPLWRGVVDAPGNQRFYPFGLGLHKWGYICQQSGPDVQRQIVEAYSAMDYAMPTKPPGASRWANWLGDLYYTFIAEHVPALAGKSVMEIGAGSFYLADRFLQENNVSQYLIIDPSLKKDPADQRIRVLREYFDDHLDVSNEHPDVIISLNCLEHVEDPYSFLVKANDILHAKGSKLALVFPDIEKQFRMGDYNALCFEHLNYFTEASATRLITQAGFSIVAFKKELDTLFYVLERSGEPDRSLPSENDGALLRLAAAKYQDGLRPVLAMIKDAQRKEQIVALHGACNGMNTLFALGGLRPEHILLFDGDETKAGKYVPSSDIPILHASSPRYRDVDLVIVTAPTFFEDIRSFLMSEHNMPSERILSVCLP
jgi:SAM-dependent methyltransferase